MRIEQRRVQVISVFVALVVGCWSVAAVSAAIIDFDATVSTTVQERIDGSPGSVSSDSEQLNDDSSNLPLVASGDLTSTDLAGALVSMGQAFSQFSDPTRLDQPNPEEFALEVACYANADSVSYSVTSEAVESRTVVFTRPGSTVAPAEIDFGLGSTRTVESRVFLSGAILLWSTQPGVSLDGMQSELRATVTRDDTGATVFETTFTVAGDGAGEVEPTADGPIRFEIVSLDDLVNEGVDDDTISILERVEAEGTLVVVVIPPQEHTYRYRVTADEPLVLRAELNARAGNIPGGTGVAATWGGPFENLADFIERGLPGVNGVAVERSLNAATASREIGPVDAADSDSTVQTPASRLCGIFGIEWAAVLAVGLFMRLGRPRG